METCRQGKVEKSNCVIGRRFHRIFADPARAANIFQRALAVKLLKAGDTVRGWTKDGWQFGTYVQGSVEGSGKHHLFCTADGTTYSTEVAEPHAFKRGDQLMAKVDGQWLPCVYQKYQDGQYFVQVAAPSGSGPVEWQVSHLAFSPDCRQPILRS